jgi:hypothetical protein
MKEFVTENENDFLKAENDFYYERACCRTKKARMSLKNAAPESVSTFGNKK